MPIGEGELRQRARTLRERYEITGVRVTLRTVKQALNAEGVAVVPWPSRKDLPGDPRLKQILGAYVEDESGPAIMLDRYQTPSDRKVFTLAHELKHHCCDRGSQIDPCSRTPSDDPLEVAADIFASEFLFPDADFRAWMERLQIPLLGCTEEGLLLLKQTTRTTLSLAGLSKRAERLGFAQPGHLQQFAWTSDAVRALLRSTAYVRMSLRYDQLAPMASSSSAAK